MRKLATIRRILSLTPIEGADKIELAQIDGWKVVVQKGLHEVGNLVVYYEIDSLLPVDEKFEFLRKTSYVKDSQEGEGFRLRTIKMRGQISQGLIMPLKEVSSIIGHLDVYEGMDVTELLNIKKYERIIPAELAGMIRGNFPSFIPKTDQERIQNFYNDYDTKYRHHFWETSLKLDGSSMTMYFNAETDTFGVCSRNLDLLESDTNTFWNVARELDVERKLRERNEFYMTNFGRKSSIAIQGELMGPGVNGNREGFKKHEFFVFDIFDIEEQKYFKHSTRIGNTEALGLQHAPIYSVGPIDMNSVDEFLYRAENFLEGKSINNPVREGMVYKSLDDPSISFKAISNKYLMNGGD